MKKILSAAAAVLLTLSLMAAGGSVLAASGSLLTDSGSVLSGDEAYRMEELLGSESGRAGAYIAVHTTNGIGNYTSIRDYADDYYESLFGARDGIMLVVDMTNREYWIVTTGDVEGVFTDSAFDGLESSFAGYLRNRSYYKAFEAFAGSARRAILEAQSGDGITRNRTFSAGPLIGRGLISAAVGLIAAAISNAALKSKLKTVRQQQYASVYETAGSLDLSDSTDRFLYSNIARTRRPQFEDTRSGGRTGSGSVGGGHHYSSSGVSHGGRGGRF